MHNTKLLEEYVIIEEQFKLIEQKKKDARAAIVADFTKKNIEKVETDFGSFTISSRTVWSYTDAVKKLEEKVKIAKTKEQEKGVADATTTEFLLYTAPKQI